jgi:hypothetical protein
MENKFTKCVVLRFTDAKIFCHSDFRSKDFTTTFDGSGKMKVVKRQTLPVIDVEVGTLYHSHICNMLHVLMGERPVPTIRKTSGNPASLDEKIVAYAKKARVEVSSVIEEYEDKKTKSIKLKYISEKVSLRKSKCDSWGKSKIRAGKVVIEGGDLTWDRVCAYAGFEVFSILHEIAIDVIGKDYAKKSLCSSLDALRESPRMEEFSRACKDARKTPLSDIFSKTPNSTKIAFGKTTGFDRADWGKYVHMTLSGPTDVNRISGKIYVPMDKDGVDRILKSTGFARLLEGGLVFIEGITNNSKMIESVGKPAQTEYREKAKIKSEEKEEE